jgi:hypothetical protein
MVETVETVDDTMPRLILAIILPLYHYPIETSIVRRLLYYAHTSIEASYHISIAYGLKDTQSFMKLLIACLYPSVSIVSIS